MTIKSPCIGICSIRGGICRGCGRTPEEIQGWSGMADDERDEIMRRLEMRRDIEPDIEDQLCARIDELMTEKEALAEQLDRAEGESDRIRHAVRRARVYAGDNLPATTGLTLVSMLEGALREGAR